VRSLLGEAAVLRARALTSARDLPDRAISTLPAAERTLPRTLSLGNSDIARRLLIGVAMTDATCGDARANASLGE
jgi:hypothetical protein